MKKTKTSSQVKRATASAHPLPDTLKSRLLKLEQGEADAKMLEVTGSPGARVQDLQDMKRRLANTMTAQIARAEQAAPDRQFELDSGVLVTNSNAVYAVCVIKRVK